MIFISRILIMKTNLSQVSICLITVTHYTEYMQNLCQVGARNVNSSLLDLASNLDFTNIGKNVGTCDRLVGGQ